MKTLFKSQPLECCGGQFYLRECQKVHGLFVPHFIKTIVRRLSFASGFAKDSHFLRFQVEYPIFLNIGLSVNQSLGFGVAFGVTVGNLNQKVSLLGGGMGCRDIEVMTQL